MNGDSLFEPELIFAVFPWGKKSHLPLDPERTEFPYQLLPNKMNVYHNQNYKTSPHLSGKTVLKRLFTVCR